MQIADYNLLTQKRPFLRAAQNYFEERTPAYQLVFFVTALTHLHFNNQQARDYYSSINTALGSSSTTLYLEAVRGAATLRYTFRWCDRLKISWRQRCCAKQKQKFGEDEEISTEMEEESSIVSDVHGLGILMGERAVSAD